ncbi:hypothetical protein [Staphylococcus pasteuri]|uniref:hypothetical protein n=2 Tax=Staphylococcus pasteuri TaxID=45972 RepID=UPI000F83A791|nr:hypothetical protein [Staphylococcus pasteuri]MEB6612976.1 hypothetical protein [Staphylococcus pasteuri]QQN54470.1 hypothetical protein I6I26_02185 [Staphylococcus pasteuri]QQT12173.1 hypothetical protein I6J09_05625 [Staphylococcus pasteuri]RTX71795.1 hypothetical protein CD121_09450 [Staphylococcus pasteuri]
MYNMIKFRMNELYVGCIFIFLFYLLISILTPLSADDFKWSVVNKASNYREMIEYTDGRYLCHLLAMTAMKINILRYILYAIISFGLVYLLALIQQQQQQQQHFNFYIVVSFIFLLIMPRVIYRETYGGFDGFFRYVPSTLISVFILFIVVLTIYKLEMLSTKWIVLFLICTLLGQFFVENITLYNILILLIGNIVFMIRHRNFNYYLIIGFMLSLIGAMLMFINPIYISIYRGGDSYFRFSDKLGLKHKIGYTLLKQIPEYIFIDQFLIVSMIGFITIGFLIKNQLFAHTKLYWKILLILSIAILPFYKLFVYDFLQFNLLKGSLAVALLNTFICGWFFIALVISVRFIFKEQVIRNLGYYALGSIPLVTLPLLLVSPLGAGNFYTIYVLWCLYLLLLISQYKIQCQSIWIGLKGFSIALAFIFIVTMSVIYFNNIQRIDMINKQLDTHRYKHVVVLERLPFENILNKVTPTSNMQHKSFKMYYDIPQNVKLKIVPYGSSLARLEGD